MKQLNIRLVLIFGVLAALVANLSFNIPGVTNLTTDPREIVALSALLVLVNWPSAFLVGLLAGLGGPYDQTLWVTVLMHVVAIPVGYGLYRQIRQRFTNHWIISLLWILLVLFLYFVVFATLFVTMHYLRGSIETILLTKSYLDVLAGMRLEALVTAGITVLILQIKLSREDQNRDAQLLGLLLKSNDFGLWDWNIRTDHITLNKNLASLLGYRVSEIGSRFEDYRKLIHLDDLEKVEAALQELMHHEDAQFRIEYRLKAKDGSWKCILANAQVVERDELAKPVRLIGTHLDISNMKQAERENETLRTQLNQVQKMEAIGTLAGGIAHDFNNLLTVINGHAEMAAMRIEEHTPAHKDVLAIHSAGKKAARLTSQLLAFSRKQVYQADIVDMNTIVMDLDKIHRRLIGEDFHVELVLAKDLPKIKGDPGQIEQVLLNLLVNGRDAINEKTDRAGEKKITIETSFIKLNDTYVSEHSYVTPGNYIILALSDNGIGMDALTLQKIFEPFYTTKELGKGTGLGLSTVYGIVKQNNGYVIVYSEPGEGTTFKVYWPISEEPFLQETIKPANTTDISGTEEILLVEDDMAVREFAESALSANGYKVVSAKDGQAAIEALSDETILPELLITDLIMPRMNGRELAEKVLQKFPNCRVLYASGYTDNHIVHKGSLEQGINFIQKPYSISQFTHKVRQILDQD